MTKLYTILATILLILSGCTEEGTLPNEQKILPAESNGEFIFQQYETMPLLDQETFSASYPFVLHESDSHVYIFSVYPASITEIDTETWETKYHLLESCDYAANYAFNPQTGLLLVVNDRFDLISYSLNGECIWSQPFMSATVCSCQNQWVVLSIDGKLSTLDQTGKITDCFSITPSPDRIDIITGANEDGITITSYPNTMEGNNTPSGCRMVYTWDGQPISSVVLEQWGELCGIYYNEDISSDFLVGHLKERYPTEPNRLSVVSVPFSGEYQEILSFCLPDSINETAYTLKYAYQDKNNVYIYGQDDQHGFMLLLNESFEPQDAYEWPISEDAAILWARSTDSGICIISGNTSPEPYMRGDIVGLNRISVNLS